MSIQALLISVAVTLVTVGVSFFYFRNRMNKTEQKVDLMFQLIQEHERNSRMAQQIQTQHMHNTNNENLINISDDEDNNNIEYDSDDSSIVSDNEDQSKLVIDEETSKNTDYLEDVVKTIPLSLDGAETTNIESLDDDDNELDDIELSDLESVESTREEYHDDGTLNNFVVTKKLNNDETNGEQNSSENENENEEKNEELDEKDNNLEQVKAVQSTMNYAKLNKNQLKQLARDKGLPGYNKLTKGGLVDLLIASP